MKTVTICGSLRFAEEMKNIAFELEAVKGCNVLQCVYNNQNMEITAEMVDAMILSMKMNEDSSLDIKFNYMDEFKAIMDKVETLRKEVA